MFDEYLHILSDPAHLAAELTFVLVVDVVLMGMALPVLKRWVKNHDKTKHSTPDIRWHRYMGDVGTNCSKGPCWLGENHDGRCMGD